jgi:hypothetical protein
MQQPTPEEANLTSQLLNDRPTIDAAVKNFLSLVVARSMTASATDDAAGGRQSSSSAVAAHPDNTPSTVQHEVLQLARAILKSVNAYRFPIHDVVAMTKAEHPQTTEAQRLEYLQSSLVARLWNNMVESTDQKSPSKHLGRRSLQQAWPRLSISEHLLKTQPQDRDTGAIQERQLEWLNEFERLLFANVRKGGCDECKDVDDDSALIWSQDKGASELAKRRHRRQEAAKERGPSTPS